MVAALAQLHDEVHQARLVGRERRARRLVEGVHVALEDVLVLLALHRRELRVDDELGLGRDGALDVDLDAPEQEGLEDAVQLRDDLLLDLLVLEVEPAVEVLRVGEDVGQQEVEQRPQLVQVVLQRRAREQQLALCLDEPQPLVEARLLVLDAVALVEHDQVGPRVLQQRRRLAPAVLGCVL